MTQIPIKTFSLSTSNFVAISRPDFQCEIINLTNQEITTLKAKMNSSSSLFWHDPYTLFIFFNDGKIIIWNYIHQIQRTQRFNELKNCNFGITTNFFSIISCEIGIVVLPMALISYSEFPLLYGMDFVLEFRMTKEGPNTIKHCIPNAQIRSVVADENEKYLAILTDNRIYLIDRNSLDCLNPAELHSNANFITFCGGNLCIVQQKSFFFFNVSDLTSSPKHQISETPNDVFSDSHGCGFVFDDIK